MTVTLPELLQDLKDGVINKTEFENYLTSGNLSGSKKPVDFKQNPQVQQISSQLRNSPTPINQDNPDMGLSLPGAEVIGADSRNPMSPYAAGGALAGAGATALSGGSLPMILAAGAGGSLSRSKGDIAANAVLGGANALLPGAGASRFIQALKGMAVGGGGAVAAEEAKSLLDKGKLTKPSAVTTGLGAALGGTAGALTAKPLNQLSAAMKRAQVWQQKRAVYDEALGELSNHARDVNLSKEVTLPAAKRAVTEAPVLAQREFDKLAANTKGLEKNAKILGGYAKEDVAAHQRALKQLKDEALRAGKNSYAAQQYDHALEVDKLSSDLIKSQKALQDANKNLKLHSDEMSANELAAKKSEVSRLKNVATENRNKVDELTKGYREDSTVINASTGAKNQAKVQYNAEARRAQTEAGNVNREGLPEPYPHPPSTLRKREDLTQAVKDAEILAENNQEALAAARQAKLSHAKLAAENGKAVPLPKSDEVDALLSKAEGTRSSARQANQDHLDHLEELARAKQNALDAPGNAQAEAARVAQEHDNLIRRQYELESAAEKLNPGQPPEVPLSFGDVAKAAGKQGLVLGAGALGHKLGGVGGGMAASGAAELMAGRSTLRNLIPKTAAEIPPIQEKTPNLFQKLLEEAGAKGLEGAVVPDMIRQLLANQEQQ